MFTSPLAFCQTEALKGVVNNLAFYRQQKDLKYLSNAKRQVDSLIKTKKDSANVPKSVFRAVVYSSILYTDSLNKLGLPANTLGDITNLVDRLSAGNRVFKYQVEIDFSKRCLSNVYIRKGDGELKGQKYEQALASFQKAQEYAPRYKRISAYIAYTNTRLGNLPEAAKGYASLLNTDTIRIDDIVAAANVYKAMKDTTKALQVIQKGRKLLPDNKDLLFDEANIYYNRKDYRGLQSILPQLLEKNPGNYEVAFIAANCYDHLNDYDRAESMYLQAIELRSRYYDAIFNLGLLYFKGYTTKNGDQQKNIDRAIQWFEKANTILPNNLQCLQLLQWAYLKTRNEDQLNRINDKLKQLTN
ncbi:tetratricopeptide repeat protein [Mucilaginibacter agri]|uniref:Tetratricopeptide repeat protein n=1 Tax=Mucilaginibacter agri TaxID=2695265 RepID=A0A965ZLR5_9SPHI|nr:tetratricopeptide repeat protein [Mucilaginibacter agri]NCD71957.1 tetratricopeptide repeat protein [Mucilaginibacter agri]